MSAMTPRESAAGLPRHSQTTGTSVPPRSCAAERKRGRHPGAAAAPQLSPRCSVLPTPALHGSTPRAAPRVGPAAAAAPAPHGAHLPPAAKLAVPPPPRNPAPFRALGALPHPGRDAPLLEAALQHAGIHALPRGPALLLSQRAPTHSAGLQGCEGRAAPSGAVFARGAAQSGPKMGRGEEGQPWASQPG